MRVSAIGKLFIQSLGVKPTGVSDWIAQRLSGVVLGVYTVFLAGYIVLNPDMDYQQWRALFSQLWMQIFTLLCLISLCIHAWVGMWTIGTDYLRPHTVGRSADLLRKLYQLVVVAFLVIYLGWGIWILWGGS